MRSLKKKKVNSMSGSIIAYLIGGVAVLLSFLGNIWQGKKNSSLKKELENEKSKAVAQQIQLDAAISRDTEPTSSILHKGKF